MKMTSKEVKNCIKSMIAEEQSINSQTTLLAREERILGNIEMAYRLGVLMAYEANALMFTSVKAYRARIDELNTKGHSVLN